MRHHHDSRSDPCIAASGLNLHPAFPERADWRHVASAALRARSGFPGLVTLRDRGQTPLHAHALSGREIGTVLIEKMRAAGDDALLGPAPANFLACLVSTKRAATAARCAGVDALHARSIASGPLRTESPGSAILFRVQRRDHAGLLARQHAHGQWGLFRTVLRAAPVHAPRLTRLLRHFHKIASDASSTSA